MQGCLILDSPTSPCKGHMIGPRCFQPDADTFIGHSVQWTFVLTDDPANLLSAWGAQAVFARKIRPNRCDSHLALFPVEINLDPATRSQAFDLADRPGRRQCRQKIDDASMTLHQHFGNRSFSGRTARR